MIACAGGSGARDVGVPDGVATALPVRTTAFTVSGRNLEGRTMGWGR